jgi:hypothetical protein
MAMFTAQIIAVAMGSRFIRWMKTKQGRGQPIHLQVAQKGCRCSKAQHRKK